ncbi:hypothetical protein ScPMuIL_010438 [Solemya velum]
MDAQALTELLECSVCLEQLDHTSKVLPCQHTFCRRCLDEILYTKRELRCPECRTSVPCPVEELPSNILLIRLLEGMKTKLTHDHTYESSPRDGNVSMPSSQQVVKVSSVSRPCAKGLFSYQNEKEESDLAFKKGDMINLHKQIDDNWFYGELNGTQGFFPSSYVQVLVPLPVTLQQSVPQCKALYDFELEEDEKDCLSFEKEEVLTVIRRVDDNWIEGKKGEKIGIFPLSFVELNDPAKLLLSQLSAPSKTSTNEEERKSSRSAGSLVQLSPPVVVPKQKRHSFTAPSHQTSPPFQHQRRSLELSSAGSLIPLSNSSADIPETASLCSVMDSTSPKSRSLSPGCSKINPTQDGRLKTDPSVVQPHNQTPSLTVEASQGFTSPIFVALYNYKPQKDDEVELRKGDYYSVSEKCQDGWYKGQCMKTSVGGVFPGNYVQQLRTPAVLRSSGSSSNSKSKSTIPAHSTNMAISSSIPSSRNTSLDTTVQKSTAAPKVSSRQVAPPLTPRTVRITSSLVNSGTGGVANMTTISVSKPSQINNHNVGSGKCASAYVLSHNHNQCHGHAYGHGHRNPQDSSEGFPSVWNSSLAVMHQSMSASANITPPNVVVGAVGDIVPSVHVPAVKEKDKKDKREKEKMSLVKRLTTGKNKKSKSGQESEISSLDSSVTHIRSGSYPTDAVGQQDGESGQHKKTGSFDSSTASSTTNKGDKTKPFLHEKFCCIVPYPPQSELELELKIGDVVFVHRKRDDGWFKGTLQRTGKTGLFPGSFVEKCD